MDQHYLKSILNYNPETGIFTWTKNGKVAGGYLTTGYKRVKIKDKTYLAHRLAWLYVYGQFTKDCIDHINGIKDEI